MRAFDWLRLFAERRIPFVERGANVKRGEVNIRCPFCGSADPSQHMGIELETGWYSCWRNRKQHSGKSPVRLIMRLLDVPYGMAREIAGLSRDEVDPEGFDAVAARLLGRAGREPAAVKRERLQLDPGFRVIDGAARTRAHRDYLARARGFDQPDDVYHLGRLYGVCAGVSDLWAGRVILPYWQDGELVTWTGRAVGDSRLARYRDLSRDESIVAPKETLYNHDAILEGGRLLAVVEGPMDALKLDYYGRRGGLRAVGLSTNSATEEQAWLLQAAASRFSRCFLMMDEGDPLGIVDSLRVARGLSFLPGIGAERVPFGAKDGAELTPAEIHRWASSLT